MVSPSKNLDVRLDGRDISDEFVQFTLRPEYSFGVIPISSGTHRLESSSGVVAHTYGFGPTDGLGHGIGGNLGNFQIGIDNLSSDLPEGETCANSPIVLKASSDSEILTSLYTSFNWDMGDGNFLTGPEVTHSYASAGEYTVTLFASKSLISCSDLSITREIIVIDPAIDDISGPELICPNVGDIEYEIAGALPDYSYQWFAEGGILTTTEGPKTEVNWTYGAAINQLKAISISPLGCASDTVYLSIGYHTVLDPILPLGDTAICGSYDDLNYRVPNTSGSVYTWSVEGGALISGQGTNDVRVKWDGPGVHKIWYSERSTTVSDLCEGTSEELEVVIVSPIDVAVNVQNASCFGARDGSISLDIIGGSGSYDINWGFGSKLANINGLASGTYEVTITDEVGCEIVSAIEVIQPDELTGHVITEDASCSADTGQAEVMVSGSTGAYTYFWDENVEGLKQKTGLAGGAYSVRVQDESGCEIVFNYTISIPQPLTATFESKEPCSGASDGELSLLVEGGVGPYVYEWDLGSGNGSNHLRDVPSGEYSVSVTDANGCVLQLEKVLSNVVPILNLPNTFSPNDDGLNDEFKAVYNCSTSFEMYVYNKWGNMVYRTDKLNEGWDGRYKGKRVPDGQYYYQIAYLKQVGGDAVTEILRGNIRVIK